MQVGVEPWPVQNLKMTNKNGWREYKQNNFLKNIFRVSDKLGFNNDGDSINACT